MAVLLLAGAGCGGSGSVETKPQHDLLPDEITLINFTNRSRIEESLEPLNLDQELCKVARSQAVRMAQAKKATVPDRDSLAAELNAAGYPFTIWGVNVAKYEKRVEDGYISLINRGRTQVEILQPRYDDVGVGIAAAEGGEYYIVQLFGSKRNK
jgi:uncharacterized protein YkwD